MFKKQIPFAPEYSITEDGVVFKNNKQLKRSLQGSARVSINRKMYLISELVATVWLEKPISAIKVIYKDGNNFNFHKDNLLWVSPNYPEIQQNEIVYNGKKYKHICCIETYQYYISEDGSIFNSVTRKEINPVKDSNGYLRFTYYFISDQKIQQKKTTGVHILVYKTFNSDYDPSVFEINHLDGNKQNNHRSNLSLVTHSENVKHSFFSGLRNEKYDDEIIINILQLLKTGFSWKQIHENYLSKKLNLSKNQSYGLINAIKNRQDAYVDLCQEHDFIKGSTTRT